MFRRLCAALAASALIAGLLAPTPALATDGLPPICDPASPSVNEDDVLNGIVNCSPTDPEDEYNVTSGATDGDVSLDPGSGSYSYTPDPNFFGTDSFSYELLDPDGDSNTATVSITVTAVNDAPSFTKGPDKNVPENDGTTSDPWATSISEGPSESSQTVSFLVSNNNTSLFSTQPAVSSSGVLSFRPATSEVGSATVSVVLEDNGGTANGGDDSSAAQTFTITVAGVNDPPSFTKGADQTDLEDAGAQSVPGWATAISPGPPDEGGQNVSFVVSNNSTGLFSSQPAVSSSGTLTYTPAANANGSATVTLHAHDNGGGSTDDSPAQTFTITVTAVNDAPSFTKGPNQVDDENAGPQSVAGWATAIVEGPANEVASQTVSFTVTNNNNVLFSVQPAINPSGTLTYTPAVSKNGVATVSVQLVDSGGVVTGGDNNSAIATFTITVAAINDPPTFAKGADQTDLEDAGAQAVPGWATAISPGPPDEAAQTLTFVIVSNNRPTLFSIQPSIGPTGNLAYSLAPNANGTATVGVELHDNGTRANGGDDTSAVQTFKINVTPQNDVPTCTNATAATFVGSALNSTLTTCADIDADNLAFALVGPAAHGTAAVNPNGSFTYTPTAAFQGNDAFTFKTNDGTLDSNVVTMGILVSPDPIAKNDVAPTDFPAIVQGSGPTAIPVLVNDQDKQGGPLTIASVTQGTKGRVAITGGGTGLTYDPTGFKTGTDSFRYTIIDNQSRTNSATVVVVIRHATPTGTRPTLTIVSRTTLGTAAKVRIIWGSADVGTGLKSYRLQQSYKGGAFKPVSLNTAKSRSVLRTLTFGKSYRYRLKVTDTAGNVSPWAMSPTFVVARSQESSVGIAYTGPWALASSATYSGGKARWANAAGASATFSFSGESVAWVSSKGRTRGSAQVLVDGVLVKTVSLFSSKTTARQVVFSTAWPTTGLHTIQIVVLGTPGHPRIDVDTFAVAR